MGMLVGVNVEGDEWCLRRGSGSEVGHGWHRLSRALGDGRGEAQFTTDIRLLSTDKFLQISAFWWQWCLVCLHILAIDKGKILWIRCVGGGHVKVKWIIRLSAQNYTSKPPTYPIGGGRAVCSDLFPWSIKSAPPAIPFNTPVPGMTHPQPPPPSHHRNVTSSPNLELLHIFANRLPKIRVEPN